MIINNKENALYFPDMPENSYSLMDSLKLDPFQYRLFKTNINRINNISKEINFLNIETQSHQINFFKSIYITPEEYLQNLLKADNICDQITENQITHISSLGNLYSSQKRVLSLFSYLIGNEYFDWSIFRQSINVSMVKEKMKSVDYSKLEKKRINLILNTMCKKNNKTLFFNEINNEEEGIKIIYEWVKSQIKIYIYKVKNNLLEKKQIDNKRNNSLKAFRVFSEKGCITERTNERKKEIIQFKVIKRNNKCNNNWRKSLTSRENEIMENRLNKKMMSNSNSSKGNNLIITGLPELEHMKLNEKCDDGEKGKKENSNNKVKRSVIVLKGYDYMKKREEREEKVMEYLPMLKYKTFHQLRKFYNCEVKANKKIEKNHFENLKISNEKLITMIANKRTSVLDNIPIYKINNLLQK